MAVSQLRQLAGVVGALERVLAQRLEHPVAIAAVRYQALVDQAREQVEDREAIE